MLQLHNVSVRLGGQTVLDGLTLDVAAGAVVAVLGASGSGKTTLLRTIAGLQQPQTGSIGWRGIDLTGTPPHRRNFGLMFQDYALFPHRTVAGNVAFGLEMQDADNPIERVREVLTLVGLDGYEERSVSTLSGGEQQRVGLARALAPAPELLMLDEPLGALDKTLRERLVFELRELFTDLDLTVMYVTHDQAEAFTVADDVVVLDGGRVVQHATPEQLWSAPATPFVAEFLGMTVLSERQATEMGGTEPRGILALRPEHAAVDPDGAVAGTVKAVGFDDGQYVVAILTDSNVHLTARSASRHIVGEPINVTLDEDALAVVAESGLGDVDH